jgi:hypothetical protein
VRRAPKALIVALVVLCAAVLALPAALADGDPASDILFADDVYLPYPAPSRATGVALRDAVATAYTHHFRLKVAVIATANDLGAVPSLFGKPSDYAHFLGDEVTTFYVGPLLIVMPNGFGIYDGGRSTSAEAAVLAKLSVNGSSRDTLVASATKAAQSLVAHGALHSKDILAPYLYLQPLTMTPGKQARLLYRVADDSHSSRETIRVQSRSGKTLKVVKTPFHPAYWTLTRAVTWSLPKTLVRAGLRYCVTSQDAGGNTTKPTCEPIAIKAAR